MRFSARIMGLFVAGLVITVSPTFAGERIYDFSDDSAWEVIGADWEIQDGTYVTTGSTNTAIALAVLKEEEGVDTQDVETLEVRGYDLGTGAWQNILIIFGYNEQEPIAYIAGAFVGGAQEWRIETFNSETLGSRTKVAGSGDNLSPQKWYVLRVVFEGDEVILYGAEEGKNLEERARYTFPNGKPSGRVGIGCSNAETKFDDFKVSGPGIIALAVEPQGKLTLTWAELKTQR